MIVDGIDFKDAVSVKWGKSSTVSHFAESSGEVTCLENGKLRPTEWPSLEALIGYVKQNPDEVEIVSLPKTHRLITGEEALANYRESQISFGDSNEWKSLILCSQSIQEIIANTTNCGIKLHFRIRPVLGDYDAYSKHIDYSNEVLEKSGERICISKVSQDEFIQRIEQCPRFAKLWSNKELLKQN